MNQSVPLGIVLAIFLGGAALWLMFTWVQKIVVSAGRISDGSERMKASAEGLARNLDATLAAIFNLTAAVQSLRETFVPASAELSSNMVAVPKILEAVAKIGAAQLEIMQAQRVEAQRLKDDPFGRRNAPLPPRDTEAANQEHAVQQMMRSEGVSREEALMRMNGANLGSVWDGGEVFRDWRR